MDISLPYSFSTLLCYSVLYLAVACLWLPASIWGQPLWLILAASAGFIALISGQLTPLGLGLAALYLFIAYLFSRTTGAKKKWLTLLLAALSVLFGAHLLPGFHNLQALNAVLVSADGLPFTMYLNLDKTLVALGLLGWCIPRLSRRQEWRQLLQVLLSRSLLFYSLFLFWLLPPAKSTGTLSCHLILYYGCSRTCSLSALQKKPFSAASCSNSSPFFGKTVPCNKNFPLRWLP